MLDRAIPILDTAIPLRRLAVIAAVTATAFAAWLLDAALTEAAHENGWPMDGYDGDGFWPVSLILAWVGAASWVVGARVCWALLRRTAQSPGFTLSDITAQPSHVIWLAAWGIGPPTTLLSVMAVGILVAAGLPGDIAMMIWFVGLIVAGALMPRLGKVAAYLVSLSTVLCFALYLLLVFLGDGIAFQLTSPMDSLIEFAKS